MKPVTTPILDGHGRDLDRGHEVPADSLKYFWDEKDDFKRWVGYEEWAQKNPDRARFLDNLVFERNWAEKCIGVYLDDLITQELKELKP